MSEQECKLANAILQAQRQALQTEKADQGGSPKTLVSTKAQLHDKDLDNHFVGEVQPA